MHDNYASPGPMTGDHHGLLAALPADPVEIAAVGHGLMAHEHLTWLHGVTFGEDDRETVHVREVPRLVERILAKSPAPLDTPRPPEQRVAANCRQFTAFLVATLRAHGTPARARCGFGTYFVPDFHEDHWVCEYWTGDRWRLVDGQIDAAQRNVFPIDFDVTDVPRDRFLVAGDAWARYRAGDEEPDTFGLSFTKEAGAWWIAQNVMRDAAALTKVELLPWDVWGAMPEPDDDVDHELFDRLAAATLDPGLTGLSDLMADPRLRVPPVVRNAVRQQDESL